MYPIQSLSDLKWRFENEDDAELLPWMRQAAALVGLSAFSHLSSLDTRTVLSVALKRESPALLNLLVELHPVESYADRWAGLLRETFSFDRKSETSWSAVEWAMEAQRMEHLVMLDRWSRSASQDPYGTAQLSWDEWVEVGYQRLRNWRQEAFHIAAQNDRPDIERGPGTTWERLALEVWHALGAIAQDRAVSQPDKAAAWFKSDKALQGKLVDSHRARVTQSDEDGWMAVAVERDALGLFQRLVAQGALGTPGTDAHLSRLGETMYWAVKYASPHVASYLVHHTAVLDAPNEHGQTWGEVWAAWRQNPKGQAMPWHQWVSDEGKENFYHQVAILERERQLAARPVPEVGRRSSRPRS